MQNRLLEVLLLLIPSGLLTTLVYLYLNAGKPTKQVRHIILVNCCPEILQNLMQGGETILLLNSKGDWEYAQRNAAQRGTPKSSSSFLAAVNYCPVDHFIVI